LATAGCLLNTLKSGFSNGEAAFLLQDFARAKVRPKVAQDADDAR
jgi:hypothetical protein